MIIHPTLVHRYVSIVSWSIDTHHHFSVVHFVGNFILSLILDWLPQDLWLFVIDNLEVWCWHSSWRYCKERFKSPTGEIVSRVHIHDRKMWILFFSLESGKHWKNRSAWWCNKSFAEEAKVWESWFWNHAELDQTSTTKAICSWSVKVGQTGAHVEVSWRVQHVAM